MERIGIDDTLIQESALGIEEFQNMQEMVKIVHREQLGQQMVCDLLTIAQLSGQPIKQMHLNKNGVFEEVQE